MNFNVHEDNDVVLFPFKLTDMDEELENEVKAYRANNLTVFDGEDYEDLAKHDFKENGRLIIFGHGTSKAEIKHQIFASKRARMCASEVAAIIATAGFPTGAANEIVCWSCKAGVPGGFAQMLALHLTSHGYTGKKVWAVKKYGGIIHLTRKYFKMAETAGDNVITRRATLADVTFWIGA
jgi:hypothetical protein